MKKILLILLLLGTLLTFFSCQSHKSTYETLSSSQQNTVDILLRSERLFGDYIKFTNYNGENYLLTYNVKWVTSYGNGPNTNVGQTTNQKLYIIKNNSLSLVSKPDAYTSANTFYGRSPSTSWDKSWPEEKKREVIARLIK